MENRQIGEAFSKGDFESVYDFFSEKIRWNIIGDQLIEGKEQVVAHCRKMLESTEGSVLHNTNVIECVNALAIEGYCRFLNEDNQPAEVNYCDIYHFENRQVRQITSYCIAFKH